LIKVFIDGVSVLEKPLPCGENCGKSWRYVERWKLWESVYDAELAVPVPAGTHRIRVENHGKDWVAVSRYTFTGCRTRELQEVNGYALAAPDVAVVWLQNADSTWVNHAQYAAEIRPYPAADFTLDGFAAGEYEVEWWEKVALKNRPEVKNKELEITKAKDTIKSKKVEYLPEVKFFAGYDYLSSQVVLVPHCYERYSKNPRKLR